MSLKKHTGNVLVPNTQKDSKPNLSLYTCEFYPTYGGIATYCHELANAAARANFQVTLHSPANSTQVPNKEIPYSLKQGSWAPNHNPPALWKLRKLLIQKLEQQKGLHILPEPGPILSLGSLSEKVTSENSIILVFHGSEILRWLKSPISRGLSRRAMQLANTIVCISSTIAKLAQETYPEFASKMISVPNALPSEYFHPQEQPTKTESEHEHFNLLSVGRFHPRKGFDQIIRALGKLPETKRKSVVYTIAGGLKCKEYFKQLRGLADQSDVALRCLTDVSSEELREAYLSAHAFALTSIRHKSSIEGFGLVYLEAGAYSLPCLAYNSGGVRDAVRHGETGFLCEYGDIDALATSVGIWIDDRVTLKKMGAANRQFAMSRTWNDVLREILVA